MPPDQKGYLVRLTMSPGVPTLGLLRSRISACLPGLNGDAIADIHLVATELVTNAYRHGRPPVQFRLFSYANDRTLRIEVSDCEPAPPEVRHPDPRTPHGRGLQLVDAFSARWGVEPATDGKTVWAEFRYPPGNPEMNSDANR